MSAEHPTWRTAEDAERGEWEGAGHDVPHSGFVVDSADGQGPAPHWHPYSETFVVLAGRVRFRRGDEELEAAAGDLVVVPPRVVHGFTAVGPERLRMVTIHAAPRMETTWVEERRQ